MSAPEQDPDVFESLGKMKMPNFTALLASKPNNIVSGAIAGIGNTVGGALIAVGEYRNSRTFPRLYQKYSMYSM